MLFKVFIIDLESLFRWQKGFSDVKGSLNIILTLKHDASVANWKHFQTSLCDFCTFLKSNLFPCFSFLSPPPPDCLTNVYAPKESNVLGRILPQVLSICCILFLPFLQCAHHILLEASCSSLLFWLFHMPFPLPIPYWAYTTLSHFGFLLSLKIHVYPWFTEQLISRKLEHTFLWSVYSFCKYLLSTSNTSAIRSSAKDRNTHE